MSVLDRRWANVHGVVTNSWAEHSLTGRLERRMTEFWVEVVTPTGTFSHLAMVPTDALADPSLYADTLTRIVAELDQVLHRH
jgi:hypothetical protein